MAVSNKKLRSGKRARIAWILAVGLVGLTGLGFKARHRLHDLARDAYHQYKAVQAEKVYAASFEPERAEEPLTIYDDHLAGGWQDWSWCTRKLDVHTPVHAGSAAISMTPENFKGLYLHHDALGATGYGTLQFYVKGTSELNLVIVDSGGKFGTHIGMAHYRKPVGDGWDVVRVPFADLGVPHLGGSLSGVVFQAPSAAVQAPILLDDISLLPDQSLPATPVKATVALSVDPLMDRHAISPLIYGMAFAPPDYLQDLRLTVNRWGGNDKSRYNWMHGNAVNAARDWGFRNRWASDGSVPPGPSSAADRFYQNNNSAAAITFLTVPTIGWVAKDTDNSHSSQDVPNQGGDALTTADGAISGYDPSANRTLTSVRSLPRKGRPFVVNPTFTGGTVYQDEWINHLVTKFGTAARGGVKFYAMDNEPDLWDNTHTDIHPTRMGYDDLLHTYLDYATAVKSVDPTAQITGPVSWGWTGYFYSPLDRGSDNFHSHADRDRHDGTPFLPWFLKQVALHDARTHQRSLDVLDIHYYPQGQGLYGGGTDRDTNARRLRATRSLWDPTYADESWINEPMRLIPQMKDWIGQNYPGTKLGITEWNFGADSSLNGGLAIADVLGVYGRENVYLANYWAYPPKNSPGYLAFKLYRNADGRGHGFGDTSVRAHGGDINRLSAYAATDAKTGYLTLIVINKMPKTTLTVPLNLSESWATANLVDAYRLSADHPASLVVVPKSSEAAAKKLILPPSSMTLYRFQPRGDSQ